jgi:hypothetical protein
MRTVRPLSDETGTTLIEMVVTIAVGMIVFVALTTVIIVSLRETGRATARVDAVQRARTTLTRIVDELHSACIAPQIAPVREGSGENSLAFIHQTGSAVSPIPMLSTISLTAGTLSQTDQAWEKGATPAEWKFAAPSPPRTLMTNVTPTAPSTGVFSYYAYTNGKISPTALPVPLISENAGRTVQVNIAFTVAPLSTPVKDPSAAASVQNSAVFRLTPASFNSNVVNLPCQ